jgi:hypothetical protein
MQKRVTSLAGLWLVTVVRHRADLEAAAAAVAAVTAAVVAVFQFSKQVYQAEGKKRVTGLACDGDAGTTLTWRQQQQQCSKGCQQH